MGDNTEAKSSALDNVKLLLATAIAVAGAMAFSYYKATSTLMGSLVMLVALGIAMAFALATEKGKRAWGFVKDARIEVRKVIWPTRQETLQTTLIVIVMVVIIGVTIWLMDLLLKTVIYNFLYVWWK